MAESAMYLTAAAATAQSAPAGAATLTSVQAISRSLARV